jgi:hypothetical protein
VRAFHVLERKVHGRNLERGETRSNQVRDRSKPVILSLSAFPHACQDGVVMVATENPREGIMHLCVIPENRISDLRPSPKILHPTAK